MSRRITILLTAGAAAGVLARVGPPVFAQAGPPRVLSFQEAMKGTDEVSLRWPLAVAAASDEEVAVADASGPRLVRFQRVGVSWRLDRAVPMGGAPAALAWDGRRYVASLRQGGGLVAFEGAELTQRRLPLPRGVVPGALAVGPDGRLLVYDAAKRSVLRLSPDGAVVAEVAAGGDVTALAATAAGGFFAAVAAEGAVRHFDAGGKLDATWKLPAFEQVPAWPTGLAAEPGGDLLVVDRHAGRVLVLDASGQVAGTGSRQGWEPGLLLFPAGIARLPGGLVLVADEGNGRAQLFRRSAPGTGP
jgi:DNA-binding beta-propeller fold protein YncE